MLSTFIVVTSVVAALSTIRAQSETEKSVNFSYRWTLNISRDLLNVCPGDYVTSPPFTTVYNNIGYQWEMHLFPKGRNGTIENSVGCFMAYKEGPMEKVSAVFAVYEEKDGHSANVRKAKNAEFSLNSPPSPGSGSWGWSDFLPVKILAEESSVTVGVSVELPSTSFSAEGAVLNELETWNIHNQEEAPNGLAESLFHDVMMSNESRSSDFSVYVKKDNITFHCHKAVLLAKVPVVQSESDSTSGHHEFTTDRVNDTTHSAAAINETLHYIYLGKPSPDIRDHVLEVLDIAETLKLVALKAECYKILVAEVNEENALDMLNIAAQYDLKILKQMSMNLIVDNLEEFLQSENNGLSSLNRDLTLELLKLSSERLRVSH